MLSFKELSIVARRILFFVVEEVFLLMGEVWSNIVQIHKHSIRERGGCFAESFHFCLRFKGFVNKISHSLYANK